MSPSESTSGSSDLQAEKSITGEKLQGSSLGSKLWIQVQVEVKFGCTTNTWFCFTTTKNSQGPEVWQHVGLKVHFQGAGVTFYHSSGEDQLRVWTFRFGFIRSAGSSTELRRLKKTHKQLNVVVFLWFIQETTRKCETSWPEDGGPVSVASSSLLRWL